MHWTSSELGAILDDGSRTGVWIINGATSTVNFTPVEVKRIGDETAFVTGVGVGQQVVALGAHLLENGVTVRIASQQEVTK